MDSKTLIFIACYNEKDNIGLLIDEVFAVAPEVHVLVVDDSSPDGTWDIIQERRSRHQNLFAVSRPGKNGIGSAHKYALLYAIRHKYKSLLTMDADFSHRPSSIPSLLAASGQNVFVTGSRYCEGGHCDYSGYRDFVSRAGNFAARTLLGMPIAELTTYFRVFDVDSLKRLPLRRIDADGYSYGVQLVYYLRKSGAELREVPIHFTDRLHGVSKIPKLQILTSAFDLIKLSMTRPLLNRDLSPDTYVEDACVSCGDNILAMRHSGHQWRPDRLSAAAFRCTSVGTRSYPPVYVCLNCGLRQVPGSLIPDKLESHYSAVVDEQYISHSAARRRQFRRCLTQIAKWIPANASLLEVGAYCGYFMAEASRRGYNIDGVEPSRWATDYARDVEGINVVCGFLGESRDKLKPRYDAVVSWDVLEHVRDPVGFVRECGDMLETDGLLLFSTLDVASWLPRLLGRRWPWLMDMHIQYFDSRSIKHVLRRGGFELVGVESYTHYAWVSYILERGARVLPKWLQCASVFLSKFVPRKMMVPVSFGDIKLYVARKTDAAAAGAAAMQLVHHRPPVSAVAMDAVGYEHDGMADQSNRPCPSPHPHEFERREDPSIVNASAAREAFVDMCGLE